MRLMFLGDRLHGGRSAYTKVGFEVCTRLVKMGHKVAQTPMAMANKMGKQIMDGVLIQNSGNDYFGEDIALDNYTEFKADMLITIKDVWLFQHITKLPINFVPMVPIDHAPVSDGIVNRLTTVFKSIAISRFGQAELRKRKIESVYIPHGVRTDLFKPLTPEEKLKAREIFGLPKDAFVIGVVAMNRSRKMIPRMLRGFKRFKELNPDINAHMMLWTDITPKKSEETLGMGVSDVGIYLVPEVFALGIQNYIHFPNWIDIQKIGGLPDYDPVNWDMRKLYGSFDVNFLCSAGEGAGLTYLESASMEVPSIGTNYAGAPEYIGPGIAVPWHDYVIMNTPGVRYALADIDGMAEALRKIYDGDKEKMARKLRRFADSYDYELIMDSYWKPFLEDCARELYPLITKGGCESWA